MGMRRRNRSERGAALIEAAMVLPILLLLTFGIWGTARAWNVHNTMDHAAREAARFGATEEPWVSDVASQAVADDVLSASSIPLSDIDYCIELVLDAGSVSPPTCGTYTNNTGTDQVYVRLEYLNYPLNFLFFSVDVDLEATALARHES